MLDQLIGGAGPDGVTYAARHRRCSATPPTRLLDEVVDAFAADDGAAVFGVVDKVIETGQDPRRFTEDLLRRLRDLVIIAAVPDAPATGLIDVPEDQAERLVAQAARFGRAELSRAADLVAEGLTEMRGRDGAAAAARADLRARAAARRRRHAPTGLGARLDRLERRMSIGAGRPRAGTPPAAAATRAGPRGRPLETAAAQRQPAPRRAAAGRGGRQPARRAARRTAVREPTRRARAGAPPRHRRAAPTARRAPGTRAAAERPPPRGGRSDLVDVRRLWPDLLEAVKAKRRFTWILLSQNAQVVGVDAQHA